MDATLTGAVSVFSASSVAWARAGGGEGTSHLELLVKTGGSSHSMRYLPATTKTSHGAPTTLDIVDFRRISHCAASRPQLVSCGTASTFPAGYLSKTEEKNRSAAASQQRVRRPDAMSTEAFYRPYTSYQATQGNFLPPFACDCSFPVIRPLSNGDYSPQCAAEDEASGADAKIPDAENVAGDTLIVPDPAGFRKAESGYTGIHDAVLVSALSLIMAAQLFFGIQSKCFSLLALGVATAYVAMIIVGQAVVDATDESADVDEMESSVSPLARILAVYSIGCTVAGLGAATVTYTCMKAMPTAKLFSDWVSAARDIGPGISDPFPVLAISMATLICYAVVFRYHTKRAYALLTAPPSPRRATPSSAYLQAGSASSRAGPVFSGMLNGQAEQTKTTRRQCRILTWCLAVQAAFTVLLAAAAGASKLWPRVSPSVGPVVWWADAAGACILALFDIWVVSQNVPRQARAWLDLRAAKHERARDALLTEAELAREAAASSERLRRQGERRLRRLLDMSEENQVAAKQAYKSREAALARRIKAIESDLKRAKREQEAAQVDAAAARSEAKTLRFSSEKAKAEATRANGDLSRARGAYKDLSTQYNRLRSGVRRLAKPGDPILSLLDSSEQSPDRKDKRPRSRGDIATPPRHSERAQASEVTEVVTSDEQPASTPAVQLDGSSEELERLRSTITRQDIVLRQTKDRMEQLDIRVASQGRYIAAKETALSTLRSASLELESDNKALRAAVELRARECQRLSGHTRYLSTFSREQRERYGFKLEWVKAEIEELLSQLSRSDQERKARKRKIKSAEMTVAVLRPSLGIYVTKEPSKRGVVISETTAGGVLDQNGVKPGDIIEWINHKRVTDHKIMEMVLNAAKPGDWITILLGTDGPAGTQSRVVAAQLPFVNTRTGRAVSKKELSSLQRLDMALVRQQDLRSA